MEKLSLEDFRNLMQEFKSERNKASDFYNEAQAKIENGELNENDVESMFDELSERFMAKYEEILDTLSKHDLSEIDFKEWEGFEILPLNNDKIIDFSNTKANLDFGIIKNDGYTLNNIFKSCKIKNFNFTKDAYRLEMFDENFTQENAEYFLADDAPIEIKVAYYFHDLTFGKFIQNINLFEGKKVLQSFRDDKDNKKIISVFGEDLQRYSHEYYSILKPFFEDWYAQEKIEVADIEDKQEKIKQFLKDAIILKKDAIELKGLHDIKKVMELMPLSDIPVHIMPKYVTRFIEEHGIEELTKLEEEFEKVGVPEVLRRRFYFKELSAEMIRKNLMNILKEKDYNYGFANYKCPAIYSKMGKNEFFKLCHDYGKVLDRSLWGLKVDEVLDKEIFERHIYNSILDGKGFFEELPNSFKEKHPELFLPSNVSKDIKEKFYNGALEFEDIRKNPELVEILMEKNFEVGFKVNGLIKFLENEKMQKSEILNIIETYGKYLNDLYYPIFDNEDYPQTYEEKLQNIEKRIVKNVLDRTINYNEDAPEFLKQQYPELFLPNETPEEMKEQYYNGALTWETIRANPEHRKILTEKNLERSFPKMYKKMFDKFDNQTMLKLGTQNPTTMTVMAIEHKEDILEAWYKSTGGKFIPHHVVMQNFPIDEIDSFLANGKNWSKLMRIDRYNYNDDGKSAMLKVAYAMGVFQGKDDSFNKVYELFTGIPNKLSVEEYENVVGKISDNEENKTLLEKTYIAGKDGNYVLGINAQKNEKLAKQIRILLEKAELPSILTPNKAHQMFDSFEIKYDADFEKFLNDNIQEIMSDEENMKDIATIQRQFKGIARVNSGRRLTLDVAKDYITSIAYEDIEIGNEALAEQAKIAGYSQEDFKVVQELYNEGKTRECSSIPRIQGKTAEYTYEMLRCDDPLAITIGTLTDCCQEIYGAGQSSMEHSVVSPDGRVFCVRDNEGRVVAQSWFWRNQYTGCFDNIEIPNRVFKTYEKEHPEKERKDLTKGILEVYKKAAQDLMQEDKEVYDELLKNKTITQEQYDGLLLGKVTIGLGYNDIADAIKSDEAIHRDTNTTQVKATERVPKPYTDASIQYTIAERKGIVKTDQENLYVHKDDIPVYDGENMKHTVLTTLKRMEAAKGNDRLEWISENSQDEEIPKSQVIINGVANKYSFKPENTKIMANPTMAIIYSEQEGKIKIGDILSAPIKEGLTKEQTQKAEKHISNQVKKAIKQIGYKDNEFDISDLDEQQTKLWQEAKDEIDKENSERGER